MAAKICLVTIQNQSTTPESLFGDMLPWLGMLAIIVLVGGVLAIWIRRRLTNNSSSQSIGYTLEDLRILHERGELSREEFDLARQAMIKGVRGGSENPPEDIDNSENPLKGRYQAGNGGKDEGTS